MSFSPLEAASWDSCDLLFVNGYESKIRVGVLPVVCFLFAGGVVGNFVPEKNKKYELTSINNTKHLLLTKIFK